MLKLQLHEEPHRSARTVCVAVVSEPVAAAIGRCTQSPLANSKQHPPNWRSSPILEPITTQELKAARKAHVNLLNSGTWIPMPVKQFIQYGAKLRPHTISSPCCSYDVLGFFVRTVVSHDQSHCDITFWLFVALHLIFRVATFSGLGSKVISNQCKRQKKKSVVDQFTTNLKTVCGECNTLPIISNVKNHRGRSTLKL